MFHAEPVMIEIDIKNRGTNQEKKELRHGDTTILTLRVLDNGKDFDLGSMEVISLVLTREDRQVFVLKGAASSNLAMFRLGGEELAVSGNVSATAQFYSNDGRVSTVNFTLIAVADPLQSYKPTFREGTLIEQVLQNGPHIIKTAQIATLGAQQATEEVQQVIAEGNELHNELEVVRDETKAVKQETEATLEEIDQLKEETELIKDETSRVKEETERVKADAEGVKDATETLRAATEELYEEASELVLVTRSVKDETEEVKGSTEAVKVETERLKEETQAVKEATETAATKATQQGEYAREQGDRAKAEADRLAGTDVSLLDNEIKGVKTQLADKASKADIQQLSLAFKGSYATLADLQTSYPNGDNANYVVLADNMIYSYKNEWVNTGIQANGTGVADNTVTPKKVTFLKTGKNILNPDTVTLGFTLNPTNGQPAASSTYRISEFIPVSIGEKFAISNPRYVAFYDSNKAFLQPSFVDNSGHPPIVVTSPQNGYMRVAISPTYFDTFQIERGTLHTAFEPFGYQLERWIDPNEKRIADISTKVNAIKQTKNLYNPSNDVIDQYVGHNDGVLRTLSKYRTTEFIPVVAGSTYVINQCRKFALFSIGRTFVSGVDINPQREYTFTPSNNGFVRFSYDTQLADSNRIQMEIGNTSTEVEQYGLKIDDLTLTSKQLKQIGLEGLGSTNVLAGKRLIGFGDSIAQGGSNNGVSYLQMIADRNNMIVSNYARGGATVAPREGYDNQIIVKVREAIAAKVSADYIIFNGLTNDANVTDETRIGEISPNYNMPSDVTTFTGAFEELIKTMRDNWTTAKIIYVRPHNMSSRGAKQILFGNRAIEVCRKWAIPVVDMYSEGNLNTQHAEMQRLYTADTYNTGLGDATHPNDEGYRKFYVPMIESKLKSI